MTEVGIIVNPMSGKDLRRILSHATTVDSPEKVKKALRVLYSMDAFGGVDKVWIMPDRYGMNKDIIRQPMRAKDLGIEVEMLDMIPEGCPEDTEVAIKLMLEKGIKCLIVMGGDGTSRLAAKVGLGEVPLIPMSTGTNNAYPKFWEGTNVGIAVSYLVHGNKEKICKQHDKLIEVYKNGKLADVALVDAAITEMPFIGSRVVADMEEITDLIVARCSPDFIGLSTLIGCVHNCEDDDDFGYHMHLCPEGTPKSKTLLVPTGSGHIDRVQYDSLKKLNMGKTLTIKPKNTGTVALDGERTVSFTSKDTLEFKITRNGPYKIDVKQALYQAMEDGFFKAKKSKKK